LLRRCDLSPLRIGNIMTTLALRTSQDQWFTYGRAVDRQDAVSLHLSPLIKFDLVSDLAAFETLEPEWDALFESSGRPTQVFQTFAWNWHWCRHYLAQPASSTGCTLAIVTGRMSDKLVLVWPLVLQRAAGLRQLGWMGDPVSQYGDILAAPEADDDAVLLAAWSFARSATRADVAHLRKVRADSLAARVLNRLGARTVATEHAPYLDLSSISGADTCPAAARLEGARKPPASRTPSDGPRSPHGLFPNRWRRG
jgi:CelD/BcsL family acetyltransferase involved in cellulose biosynthesis